MISISHDILAFFKSFVIGNLLFDYMVHFTYLNSNLLSMATVSGPLTLTEDVLKPDELGIEIKFADVSDPATDNPETGERVKKGKIGHRRTDKQGEVSYKRVPTNALMRAIQLGIANSIGSLAGKPRRDILVQDFDVIDSVPFPSDGSQITPSHEFGEFRFKTYAPIAFRYFRELFNIKPVDFMKSLCVDPLRELSNPGASGSIFYVSTDDKFIIKTVQHKEAEFLRKLLPGYYMNLHQNPRTLLPKFFGLFCYQSLGKNIRLLVMNNLLPQAVKMHYKFDLKGSTYKRYASKAEREKDNPTLKDLDFNQEFPNGILLDTHIHDILMDIIKRDCLVLESFKIMDYSLLMGVHNIDAALANCTTNECVTKEDDLAKPSTSADNASADLQPSPETWKSLQLDFSSKNSPHDEGGVPARNSKGERLLIYLGIIDILQSYRLFKKLEHTWKSVLHDGESISVTNPGFYAARFQAYLSTIVFRKPPVDNVQPVRHPSKFRSFVHSYIAMKQTPMRQQQRLRISGTDHEDQQQQQQPLQQQTARQQRERAEDAVDTTPQTGLLSQRGTSERRSYYSKTHVTNEFEKRRRVERLFASKSNSNVVVDDGPTTAQSQL